MKINYYNADNQIFIIELILLVISQNDPLNRKADKPERQNYFKSFSILSMAKWLLRQILLVVTQSCTKKLTYIPGSQWKKFPKTSKKA